MLKTNSKFKLITIFLFASLLFFSAGLVFSESNAKADTGNVYRKDQGNTYGDGCTYNGTLMNTVIFVEFVDDNNNNVGWANGFNINIKTTDPRNIADNKKLHSGIVKHIDKPNAEWKRNQDFWPGGPGHYANCNLGSINKNGTAKALNFTDQFHDLDEWKLACGYALHNNKNLIFDITGSGEPSGIPNGYVADGWQNNDATISDGSDANYKNVGVHLKYRVVRPKTANINPGSGPDGTIYVGQTFNFSHFIDTGNLTRVGNDTFSWSITGPGAKSGTTAIAPAGRRVTENFSTRFDTRQQAERIISVTNKPAYAQLLPGGNQKVKVLGWTLQAGYSGGGKLNVGTTGTINYTVDNVDTSDSFDGAPTHKSVAVTFSGGNPGSNNTSIAPGFTAGEAPKGYTRTFSPDVRGRYCSTIYATPSADNNSAATSSEGCFTVDGWDINAYSKVDGATSTDGRSKVIYVGGSATFRHRLYSSGDPLHKAIDGDVVTSNGTATMPGCSSTGGTVNSECWQYRFINVDLAPGNSDRTATRTYTFTEPGTYCENLRFNPGADNDPTPNMFDYNNYSNGTSACVYVIDPKPVVTSLVDYEKNSSTTSEVINFQIKNSSSYCPPAGSGTIPVTLTYAININGTFGGSVSKNYGNGSCDDLSIGVSDVPVDKRATLNNSEPGKLFPYTVNYTQAITTVNANGNIRVVEVPFARFYGNDVYATGGTSGKITFNDTYNNDSGYDGRASVAQYAALASNSIALDTAAYRSIAPLPPSGLDSPGSLLPKTAGKVYDKVVESMPSTCGTLASGVISLDALATNCYVASQPTTTINGSSYANKVTIKGQNVVIGGGITNNSSYTIAAPPVIVPPPPANIATVYQHILFNAPPWNIPGAYAVNLGEGSYTTAQLVARGIPANDISSLKINSSGYRVILFDNNNFTGESRTIVSDANDFTNPGIAWNDRTESIRIEKIVPPPPPTPPSINLISFGVLLIVADNIYISPSVQRIDAILVAKNIIYTCSNGTNPVVNSALDETCRSSLTINGSLSAPTIKYQRVGGSRYLSEAPGSEEQNCATNKAILHCSRSANMPFNTGKTAEIINFPAYLYWANPYLKDESKNGAKVDAIFNAPPRL